jgi:hypothetical protein
MQLQLSEGFAKWTVRIDRINRIELNQFDQCSQFDRFAERNAKLEGGRAQSSNPLRPQKNFRGFGRSSQ